MDNLFYYSLASVIAKLQNVYGDNSIIVENPDTFEIVRSRGQNDNLRYRLIASIPYKKITVNNSNFYKLQAYNAPEGNLNRRLFDREND